MSGRVLLDTSIVIAHFRNDPELTQHFLDTSSLFLPVISIGELYSGAFRKQQNREKALETVKDFVSTTTVLRPDQMTAWHYGAIRSQLFSKGKPIPENDLWIAAMAIQYNLPLANRDSHFDRIEHLEQMKW